MQKKYKTKDMKASTTKVKKPSSDVKIWKDGSVWKFIYDGSEWHYDSEENAEIGLRSVSGASKNET